MFCGIYSGNFTGIRKGEKGIRNKENFSIPFTYSSFLFPLS